jgi:hypothetical protein
VTQPVIPVNYTNVRAGSYQKKPASVTFLSIRYYAGPYDGTMDKPVDKLCIKKHHKCQYGRTTDTKKKPGLLVQTGLFAIRNRVGLVGSNNHLDGAVDIGVQVNVDVKLTDFTNRTFRHAYLGLADFNASGANSLGHIDVADRTEQLAFV